MSNGITSKTVTYTITSLHILHARIQFTELVTVSETHDSGVGVTEYTNYSAVRLSDISWVKRMGDRIKLILNSGVSITLNCPSVSVDKYFNNIVLAVE